MMFTFLSFCAVIMVLGNVCVAVSRYKKTGSFEPSKTDPDDHCSLYPLDAVGIDSFLQDALHETLSDADER